MSGTPGKFHRFWSELRRRKVIRSLTVYAASAFIIIEAGDIILPRLGLPDWTVTFLIILVIAGFPATIILSWIFDLGPGGMERTSSLESLDKEEVRESGEPGEATTASPTQKRGLKASDVIIAVLLVVVVILLYPKVFQKDRFEQYRDEKGRISLAVLPFENLTGDTTLNYLQRGLSTYLSNDLGNSEQLSVMDDHSVFELTRDMGEVNLAGFEPGKAGKVARALKSQAYLTGSFQGRDGNYLVLADLVESESGEKIWTGKIGGNLENAQYFNMTDSLSRMIRDHLEIKVMKQEADQDLKEAFTSSAEAYRYYITGMTAFLNGQSEDAIRSLTKSLEYDAGFTLAKFYMGLVYNDLNLNEESALWIDRAWEDRDELPDLYRRWLELGHACLVTKSIREIREICRELQDTETESRLFWFDLGQTQASFLDDYESALRAFEKVEEISLRRGTPWLYPNYYRLYVELLHKQGDHAKEREINAQGQEIDPGPGWMWFHEAVCAASQGNWEEFEPLMKKITNFWEEYDLEPKIREYYTALMFQYAELPDSVLYHQQRGWELAPDDPYRIFTYGRALIMYDRDVNKGLEILESIPDFPGNRSIYLYTIGLGYQKLGDHLKARELFHQATEARTTAFGDLEKAKRESEKILAAGE
jgi:TolB-like protein